MLICISIAAAQNVRVDFSGTLTQYYLPTGELTPTNLYQLGDTFQARLIYDTESLIVGPFDTWTAENNWWRIWRGDNAMIEYSLSVTRNGQVIDQIDLFQNKTLNLTLGATSYIHDELSMAGETEETFGVYVSDFIRDEATFPAVEKYVSFELMAIRDLFIDVPFEPERILDADYFLSPAAGTLTGHSFSIGSRYWVNHSGTTDGEAYVFSVDTVGVAVVPEPASLGLLMLGSVILGLRKRP
jgi:hypothetical protein